MDLDAARRVLDEFAAAPPLVAPSIYGEPLLIPNLEEALALVKERGGALSLNTNGLTLTTRISETFCRVPVDSVLFSIDAVSREIYQRVRSIDRIGKVEAAVMRLLAVRGDQDYPRVGVSFTVQDDNRLELDQFVRRWVGAVDVVRVGVVFEDGKFPDMTAVPEQRTPCPVLYKSLAIHNDGSVRMCCLDATRQTDMGNVFTDGVNAVWHGPAFTAARKAHEEGDWDSVPFCKDCNGWMQYDYQEEIQDGILIRRSPEYTWYNRIDRLGSWKGNLLGGHETNLQAKS